MHQSTKSSSPRVGGFGGDVLIKIRLWFYSLSFAHLAFLAVKLLMVDFREADDPSVWLYEGFKWKLITCWFNLLSLAYLPVCIYCDWRELRRECGLPHVKILNKIKLICFTSILLPTTTFADTLFWRLWNKDRNLIAPESVDKLIPFWTQHCMHTVTLIAAIADLILAPRQRPKSLLPGFVVMGMFIGAYSYVCINSIMQGEYLYPILKLLSTTELVLLQIYVILELSFYYFVQWIIIDLIWGEKSQLSKNKKEESDDKSGVSNFGSFLVGTVMPILGISKSATN